MKAVNSTQFLGFGKDITLFVYLTVIPIVILSTFEEFTGIIYEVHHNDPGKFSVEVFEKFPCVSIGMLKQFTFLLLRFLLQQLLNFTISRDQLVNVVKNNSELPVPS